MKKQRITPASLTSPATNSHIKGLQQYCTPEVWAQALGAALPEQRRTIFDPFCGTGSLVRGLANDTTRDALGLDIDPTATLGGDKAWQGFPGAKARRECAHGDFLDLLPLLEETGTKFDLVALNPPFSLEWPTKLLPAWMGPPVSDTVTSTLATLRIAPRLLTERGEAVMIANASTIQSLRDRYPLYAQHFEQVWLAVELPSFFPGTDPALRIAVLYMGGKKTVPECRQRIAFGEITPEALAEKLDKIRRQWFSAPCVDEPWHACRDSARAFVHCAEEMERRRNPGATPANVVLDQNGRIRTWVSAYQERSFAVPKHLADFLRKINRTHPLELTIQNATRAALREAVNSGVWTIDPPAEAAIREALASFDRERAPLAALPAIQRLGWIDDTEELLCIADFHEFKAGKSYPLTSETIEWKKEVLRPRYHAGKRDKERILTRGTDLRITLHNGCLDKHTFTYNPENLHGPSRNRDHTLAELAAHFLIPEVPDITSLHPERYAANLALIDELEASTP